MRERINCFLACDDLSVVGQTLVVLRESEAVSHTYLLVSAYFAASNHAPVGCDFITVDDLTSTKTMMGICEKAYADYALISLDPTPFQLGLYAIERFVCVADDSNAPLVYSDYYAMKGGVTVKHLVIDYQKGSVRDDFDFGQVVIVRSRLLREYAKMPRQRDYKYAGFYDLRLFLSRKRDLFHLNEFLYTEQELGNSRGGEKQFDYVDPRNRDSQVEMEQVATAHLGAVCALVDSLSCITPNFNEQDFECEASIIIPVFNREKTIADAIQSALGQEAAFRFNVIVVDNNSTDDTTAIVSAFTADERLIHIIPNRNDLGIGGCWNVAVNDHRCGRFAVQLDSDDLYSSPDTLRRVIDAFHQQHAAMIVGSYRICDFELNTLPPGLVSHEEWTNENGCNNALRINGLGAPRAFFTPVLRRVQFPNTSYGEDYAVGLAFSRNYKIGRIYDELYLCRRWNGNSDAALSVEKINANSLYKDSLRTLEISARQQMHQEGTLRHFFDNQLNVWALARDNFNNLMNAEKRTLNYHVNDIVIQFNPARITSTKASIDKLSIAGRPCFLCDKNRPKEQMSKDVDYKYKLLVNPFPILPYHFTIVSREHQPQRIMGNYSEMHRLLSMFEGIMVFYNGPRCGASAPDHLHFQAGESGVLPLQMDWERQRWHSKVIFSLNASEKISVLKGFICPALVITSNSEKGDTDLFNLIYNALPLCDGDAEPMMNIISWRHDSAYVSVIFPREKHRPDCYYAQGNEQILVSPGALDMAGLVITPRQEDFERLTAGRAWAILREVAISESNMRQVINKIRHHA